MAPILISDDDLEDALDESLLVHAWRVEQLQRLGLPHLLWSRRSTSDGRR
jgi:hypothetical protein